MSLLDDYIAGLGARDSGVVDREGNRPSRLPSLPSLPEEASSGIRDPFLLDKQRQQQEVPVTIDVMGKKMTREQILTFDHGDELLKTLDKKGQRGFGEAYLTGYSTEDLPLVGRVAKVERLLGITNTFNKLHRGEMPSDAELVDAQAYLSDMERKESQSWTGAVGDILRKMPLWMLEFLAYKKLFGGAVTAVAGKLGIPTAEAGLEAARMAPSGLEAWTAWAKYSGTEIGKAFALGTAKTVGDVAVVGPVANLAFGQNAFESNASAQKQLEAAAAGEEINVSAARWAGIGDTWVENVSEYSGGAISSVVAHNPLARYVGRALVDKAASPALKLALGEKSGGVLMGLIKDSMNLDAVDSALKTMATDAAGKTKEQLLKEGGRRGLLAMRIAKFCVDHNVSPKWAFEKLKEAGYDGYLEEMQEERLGGFMRGMLGIGKNDEAGFRSAVDEMWWDNFDDFKAEAVSFAMPIVAVMGLAHAQSMAAFGPGGASEVGRDMRGLYANLSKKATDSGAYELAGPETGEIAGALDRLSKKFVDAASQHGFMRKVAIALLRTAEGFVTGNPEVLMYGNAESAFQHAGLSSDMLRQYKLAHDGWSKFYTDKYEKQLAVLEDGKKLATDDGKKAEFDVKIAEAKARIEAAPTEARAVADRHFVSDIVAAYRSAIQVHGPEIREAARADLEEAARKELGPDATADEVKARVTEEAVDARSKDRTFVDSLFGLGDKKAGKKRGALIEVTRGVPTFVGTAEAYDALNAAQKQFLLDTGTSFYVHGDTTVKAKSLSPATRKMLMRSFSPKYTREELQEMIDDPSTPEALHLMRLLPIKSYYRRYQKGRVVNAASAFQALLRSRVAWMDANTPVKYHINKGETADAEPLVVGENADGSVRLIGASRIALGPVRDKAGSDRAFLDILLQPEGEYPGFVTYEAKDSVPQSLDQVREYSELTLNLGSPIALVAETAYEAYEILKNDFGYDYGNFYVDPNAKNKESRAAELLKEIGVQYVADAKGYVIRAGATNDDAHPYVSLAIVSGKYAVVQDVIEKGHALDEKYGGKGARHPTYRAYFMRLESKLQERLKEAESQGAGDRKSRDRIFYLKDALALVQLYKGRSKEAISEAVSQFISIALAGHAFVDGAGDSIMHSRGVQAQEVLDLIFSTEEDAVKPGVSEAKKKGRAVKAGDVIAVFESIMGNRIEEYYPDPADIDPVEMNGIELRVEKARKQYAADSMTSTDRNIAKAARKESANDELYGDDNLVLEDKEQEDLFRQRNELVRAGRSAMDPEVRALDKKIEELVAGEGVKVGAVPAEEAGKPAEPKAESGEKAAPVEKNTGGRKVVKKAKKETPVVEVGAPPEEGAKVAGKEEPKADEEPVVPKKDIKGNRAAADEIANDLGFRAALLPTRLSTKPTNLMTYGNTPEAFVRSGPLAKVVLRFATSRLRLAGTDPTSEKVVQYLVDTGFFVPGTTVDDIRNAHADYNAVDDETIDLGRIGGVVESIASAFDENENSEQAPDDEEPAEKMEFLTDHFRGSDDLVESVFERSSWGPVLRYMLSRYALENDELVHFAMAVQRVWKLNNWNSEEAFEAWLNSDNGEVKADGFMKLVMSSLGYEYVPTIRRAFERLGYDSLNVARVYVSPDGRATTASMKPYGFTKAPALLKSRAVINFKRSPSSFSAFYDLATATYATLRKYFSLLSHPGNVKNPTADDLEARAATVLYTRTDPKTGKETSRSRYTPLGALRLALPVIDAMFGGVNEAVTVESVTAALRDLVPKEERGALAPEDVQFLTDLYLFTQVAAVGAKASQRAVGFNAQFKALWDLVSATLDHGLARSYMDSKSENVEPPPRNKIRGSDGKLVPSYASSAMAGIIRYIWDEHGTSFAARSPGTPPKKVYGVSFETPMHTALKELKHKDGTKRRLVRIIGTVMTYGFKDGQTRTTEHNDSEATPEERWTLMEAIYNDRVNNAHTVYFIPPLGERTQMYGVGFRRDELPKEGGFKAAAQYMYDMIANVLPADNLKRLGIYIAAGPGFVKATEHKEGREVDVGLPEKWEALLITGIRRSDGTVDDIDEKGKGGITLGDGSMAFFGAMAKRLMRSVGVNVDKGGRWLSTVKAHYNLQEIKDGVTVGRQLFKSLLSDGDKPTDLPPAFQRIAKALQGAEAPVNSSGEKFEVFTEGGAAKFAEYLKNPDGVTDRIVEIKLDSGDVLLARVVEMRREGFMEVASVDSPTSAHDTMLSANSVYDFYVKDSALNSPLLAEVERVVSEELDNLDHDTLLELMDIRTEAVRVLRAAGVDPLFPTTQKEDMAAMVSAIRRAVVPYVSKVSSANMPSGGVYTPKGDKKHVDTGVVGSQEDIARNTHWHTGNDDALGVWYVDEEGLLVPASIRANIGSRAYRRKLRITVDTSDVEVNRNRIAALGKESKGAIDAYDAVLKTKEGTPERAKATKNFVIEVLKTGNIEVIRDVLLTVGGARDSRGQFALSTIGFGDLLDGEGAVRRQAVKILPNGEVWLCGTLGLWERIPGGHSKHPHLLVSIDEPATEVEGADGVWVPGGQNFTVLHPYLVWLSGTDYDGDKWYGWLLYSDRTGRAVGDGGKEVDDLRWRRRRSANVMFRSLLDRQFSDGLADWSEPVDPTAYDDVEYTEGETTQTVSDWAEQERDGILSKDTPIEAKYKGMLKIAQQTASAKANVVKQLRVIQTLLRALGGTYEIPGQLILDSGRTIHARRSEISDGSDKPLAAAWTNAVNIAIDSIKTNTIGFLGLHRSLIPLLCVFSAAQNYDAPTAEERRKKFREFMSLWVEFVNSPLGRKYREVQESWDGNTKEVHDWRKSVSEENAKISREQRPKIASFRNYVTDKLGEFAGDDPVLLANAEFIAKAALLSVDMNSIEAYLNNWRKPPVNVDRWWAHERSRAMLKAAMRGPENDKKDERILRIDPRHAKSHLVRIAEAFHQKYTELVYAPKGRLASRRAAASVVLSDPALSSGRRTRDKLVGAFETYSLLEVAWRGLRPETTDAVWKLYKHPSTKTQYGRDRRIEDVTKDSRKAVASAIASIVGAAIDADTMRPLGEDNTLLRYLTYDAKRNVITADFGRRELSSAEREEVFAGFNALGSEFPDGIGPAGTDVRVSGDELGPLMVVYTLLQHGLLSYLGVNSLLPLIPAEHMARLDKARTEWLDSEWSNETGPVVEKLTGFAESVWRFDAIPFDALEERIKSEKGKTVKKAENKPVVKTVPTRKKVDNLSILKKRLEGVLKSQAVAKKPEAYNDLVASIEKEIRTLEAKSEKVPTTSDVTPGADPEKTSERFRRLSAYKGVPIVYTSGMAHWRKGHPVGAKEKKDERGRWVMYLDLKELEKSFKAKQWTAPRVPGVVPLPRDFFKTADEWVEHVLEHGYQHTQDKKARKKPSEMSNEEYAAYEMEIDDAALAARGLPTRSSFAKVQEAQEAQEANVSEEQELRIALANGTGYRGLTPEQASRYNVLVSAEEDGTLSEAGKKDLLGLRAEMTGVKETAEGDRIAKALGIVYNGKLEPLGYQQFTDSKYGGTFSIGPGEDLTVETVRKALSEIRERFERAGETPVPGYQGDTDYAKQTPTAETTGRDALLAQQSRTAERTVKGRGWYDAHSLRIVLEHAGDILREMFGRGDAFYIAEKVTKLRDFFENASAVAEARASFGSAAQAERDLRDKLLREYDAMPLTEAGDLKARELIHAVADLDSRKVLSLLSEIGVPSEGGPIRAALLPAKSAAQAVSQTGYRLAEDRYFDNQVTDKSEFRRAFSKRWKPFVEKFDALYKDDPRDPVERQAALRQLLNETPGLELKSGEILKSKLTVMVDAMTPPTLEEPPRRRPGETEDSGTREALAEQDNEIRAAIVPVEISSEGVITLGFSWRDRIEALSERIKKQQSLWQQLAKVNAPRDEAAAFLKWAEGKKGDSSELLKAYEAEVLPKLEIAANTTKKLPNYFKVYGEGSYQRLDTGNWIFNPLDMSQKPRPATLEEVNDAYTEGHASAYYESLSVNQGQGTYKEYFIRTPFLVPGQHGKFKDPNLAGWFRVREYRPPTGDLAELEAERESVAARLNEAGEQGYAFSPEDLERDATLKADIEGLRRYQREPTGRYIEIQEFQTAMATLFEFADWSDKPKTLANIDAALVKLRERLAQEKAAGKDTSATENRIRKVEEAREQAVGFDAPWAWRGPNNETFLMNALGKDKTHEEVFVNAITQWAKNQGAADSLLARQPSGGLTRQMLKAPYDPQSDAQTRELVEIATRQGYDVGWHVTTRGEPHSAMQKYGRIYIFPDKRSIEAWENHAYKKGWEETSPGLWEKEGEKHYTVTRVAYRSSEIVDLTKNPAYADWQNKHSLTDSLTEAEARQLLGSAKGGIAPMRNDKGRPVQEVVLLRDADWLWLDPFSDDIAKLSPPMQQAKNQGFEKIRFPTGETAARVEGHQAIADRLAELQEERGRWKSLSDAFPKYGVLRGVMPVVGSIFDTVAEAEEDASVLAASDEAANAEHPEAYAAHSDMFRVSTTRIDDLDHARGWGLRAKSKIDAEINELKTQGIEKFAPIEAFYEKRVAAIVNRMGAVPVTDANGNTWREVALDIPSRAAILPSRQALYKSTVEPMQRAEMVIVEPPEPHTDPRTLKDPRQARRALQAAKTEDPGLYAEIMSLFPIDERTEMTAGENTRMAILPTSSWLGSIINDATTAGSGHLQAILVRESRAAMRLQGIVHRRLFDHMHDFGVLGGDGSIYAKKTREGMPLKTRERPRWWTRQDRLTEEEQKVVGLLLYAAHQLGEYGDAEATQKAILTSGFLTGYDFDSYDTVDKLATVVPRDLAEKLMAIRTRIEAEAELRFPGERELKRGVDIETVHRAIIQNLKEINSPVYIELSKARHLERLKENEKLLAEQPGNEHLQRLLQRMRTEQGLMAARIAELRKSNASGKKEAKDEPVDSYDMFVQAGIALAWRPGGKVSGRTPSSMHWYIPYSLLKESWDSGDVKKKLKKANRSDADLDILNVVSTVRKTLDEEFTGVVSMSEDMPIADAKHLLYRGAYATHYYGLGIPGTTTRDALDALVKASKQADEKLAAKFEKMLEISFDKNHNPRPLSQVSAAQLKLMFKLLGVRWPEGSDAQLQAVRYIQSGALDDLGLSKTMQYADVVREIHKAMESAYVRKAQIRAAEIKAGAAQAGRPIDVVTGDPRFDDLADMSDFYALMKHIKKAYHNFNGREFSARQLGRKFDTYREAYEKTGRLPEGLTIFEALQRYTTDIVNHTLKKVVLNQFVLGRNAEGSLLVIPSPNLGYEGRGIIEDVTWGIVARDLAAELDIPVPRNMSAREAVAEMIEGHISRFSKGYAEVESPHFSVERFYTLKRPNENVLDMTNGGEVAGMLKHLLDSRFDDSWGVIKFIEHANAWMKMMNVQLSAFFVVAGMESALPMTGSVLLNPKNWGELLRIRRLYKASDPDIESYLQIADELGMAMSRNSNPMGIPTGMVEKDIDGLSKLATKWFGTKTGWYIKQILELPKTQTNIVFDNIFNTLKLYVMMYAVGREYGDPSKTTYEQRKAALAKWSHRIDASLGGVDWNEYSWASPKFIQALNSSMFSPQWAMSVWNQAGGGVFTGPVLKNWQSMSDVRYMWFHMLPLMTFYAAVLAPAILQALVYMLAGDDDKDDTPWMWMNEEGRRLSADITPLMRTTNPMYKGDPTGRRRVYIRWGKQVFETARWFTDPMGNLTSKASPVLRLASELATGETLGYEWDLGFKNMGLAGWFVGKDGNFLGSRTGHIAKTFAPFSILSLGTRPDAGLMAFFGPTRKGVSFGTATQAVHDILAAYADEGAYDKIHANPKVQTNLEAMLSGVLDACVKNGYDAKKALDSGRAMVLRDLYAEYYKLLPSDGSSEISDRRLRDLERVARKILRVNGTVDGIRRSVKNRDGMYGVAGDRTKEQLDAIKESFEPSGK